MARRSRHVLALLPEAALALTALAGCATSTNSGGGTTDGGIKLVKEGKLVTCTHLSYKPFQYTDGDKTVGFDVDLVDLIADELKVKQEIFDTQFETITSGASFNANQCDVAAAGMTIKEERKQAIDFSDPYFDASQALLVKKDSGITDLASLRGKKIGVQANTTGEDYAKENQDKYGYKIKQYEDVALEQTAVKTGQIDAGINDNSVLYDFVNKNDDTAVTEEFPTGEAYGIAVKKGNKALLAVINEVLKTAKDDGTYDEIFKKWFPSVEQPK